MLATLLDPDTLVGIERRKKYSAMWVGVPFALTRNWLSPWEVNSKAVWHEPPLGYRPRTIALVLVGNHYLRGLAAVVGDRPPQDLPYDWAARTTTVVATGN
ncbi:MULTISPECIES: hypothetical protein [unclassified Rathayibacter]|uniref:hypothetical protein n=1 Tax=unclassified Rathayibacter TaxID=2609250 RepID=UPI00188D5E9A|nr:MULTISPECIES: hypothetical protein [unclassified Rathayibacter]MBF4462276.1 hypothetical protein [Rathayibacter sp. VKM Ac-2879]MBF4503681.1 hypothetical protein [Rathayibacter sp. VKM Ac-2878]